MSRAQTGWQTDGVSKLTQGRVTDWMYRANAATESSEAANLTARRPQTGWQTDGVSKLTQGRVTDWMYRANAATESSEAANLTA